MVSLEFIHPTSIESLAVLDEAYMKKCPFCTEEIQVAPRTPVSPFGPVAPSGPVAPELLVASSGPMAPVAPAGPVGPVTTFSFSETAGENRSFELISSL